MKQFTQIFLLTVTLATSGLVARERTVVVFGTDVTVEAGEQVASAVSLGGNVEVYGEVREAVVALGGDVIIHSGGVVEGDAVAVGGKVFLNTGGTLEGDLVEVKPGSLGRMWPPVHYFSPFYVPWALKMVSLMGLLAIVVIISLLFPGLITGPAHRFEIQTGKTFLMGMAAVLLFIPLIVLLFLSIIGIPLIPLLIFIYGLAYLTGYLSLGTVLGKRLLKSLNFTTSTLLVNALVGVCLLWGLSLVPFIGFFLKIGVFLGGLGLMLLSLASLRNRPAAETV